MNWTEKQRNEILNHAMDLAANVDNFRQVVILTVTNDGTMKIVQRKRDDATRMETLGMYRLMARDEENQLQALWRDRERPMSEEGE